MLDKVLSKVIPFALVLAFSTTTTTKLYRNISLEFEKLNNTLKKRIFALFPTNHVPQICKTCFKY